MDDSTVRTIVTLVTGGGAVVIGNFVVKLFLTYTGWKKEEAKSTHDELYKMIDELKRDRESERQENRRAFAEERAKTEKEIHELRLENTRCKDRELYAARRIARLEVFVDSLVDRIKQTDPQFAPRMITDDASDQHTPLPPPPTGGK